MFVNEIIIHNYLSRDDREEPGMNDYHGAHGGQAPPLAFSREVRISKVSFLKSSSSHL